MSVSGTQLREIAEQFKAAYPDITDFTNLLLIDLDQNPDDISPPTRTREQRILQTVAVARQKGWIKELMLAALNDAAQAANAALRAVFGPILAMLDPEPGVPAHNHLTTDGVAFANRSTLRMTVGDMCEPAGPRTLVLRGASLCGTSYAWRLINHVARDKAIKRLVVDFSEPGDHSPLGVAHSLAAQMGLTTMPQRHDNPTQEQLAAWLIQWLSGQWLNSPETWWIVFDNAQRETVPPVTREMISGLAHHLSRGTLDNVRLFVLGFSREISGLTPPFGIDISLQPIGRSEVKDFLTEAHDRFGTLPGDFHSVDEMVNEVLADFDPQAPSRKNMEAVADQLGLLVSEMRP
ncbi:effector-associated domain EAD1-containing protein [Alisedimentitalea sp. MJ-SS2]|uniref:effector-associated domain EAD1-containing protein n=1 Tax=Aliisedimentitalea sp. MJ-SS2 TaxID=3049795 RepID=UPI00290C8233|nr:effector-associated domain EAD1-containing protein [Alisedimentitalea sp. MJ-SS2]MDU8929918.1 effector-associated domain EAD1-containing protein [Alisedimentitalea sp. MJ-SS2]